MTEASACGQNQRACAREAFGGGVGVACLFGGWCLVSPPRCATDRLVLLLSSVGRAGPGAATDAGSSTAATVGTSSTADKELEEVPRTVIDKAKTYAQHMEAVVNSLPHMRQTLMSGYIEELCKEFMCSQDVARRALNAATMPEATDALLSPGSSTEQSMHDISTSPRASPEGASGVAASGQLLPAHDLPMWDDRANWIINEHNDKELVYELVKRLVLDDPIMKDLLSWCLNDSDITIFVQRPEQSGKTFVCVLLAWLSNICYGQAAYVLLRSGGVRERTMTSFASTLSRTSTGKSGRQCLGTHSQACGPRECIRSCLPTSMRSVSTRLNCPVIPPGAGVDSGV